MNRRHAVTVVLLIMMASLASAEIPQVISYQGKVTDASGNPVADGSYSMRFRIYDALTVGTLLWDSGVRTVAVAGGVFSVLLGESPQPAIVLDFSQDYWLQVTFSGVDQSPRQRLASTGYAYMASGLVPGTEVWGSAAGNVFTAVSTSTATDAAAVWASSNATTGATHGLYAANHSPDGSAVFARGLASTGDCYGVFAQTSSTGGTAIYGEAAMATGSSYGVDGASAGSLGVGVRGRATDTTGTTYGVRGEQHSISGAGVYGSAEATTGTTCGVYGWSTSSAGTGVYGGASATTGITYGVRGYNISTAGFGGFFHADSNDPSSTAAGVYGRIDADGTTTLPVFGVAGHAYFDGVGVGAWSYNGEIFRGYDGDYPGGTLRFYFLRNGWVYADGGYGVFAAAKDGTKKALYAMQSPEIWVEDFGTATLNAGRAAVGIPEDFATTVSRDASYHVFLTPLGPSEALYVASKGTESFEVRSMDEGSAVSFDYRIVARRAGLEGIRMAEVPVAEAPAKLESQSKHPASPGVN